MKYQSFSIIFCFNESFLQFPDNAPTTLEDLGSRDAVLSVNVGNMGPSIIPNAQLTIFFPAVFGVTDYLYPFQLDNIVRPILVHSIEIFH